MTRRTVLLGAPALLLAARPKPAVAVTIDDVAWRGIPRPWRDRSADTLLSTFAAHRIKAMLFAAGSNVDDAEGKALLQRWNDQGHSLANHTYEHRAYGRNGAVMPAYGRDILRCDELLRPYSRFRKFLRFPTLHEGDNAQDRDRMRAFLHEQGYRNGHVTIDNSDWYYDSRLRQKLVDDPGFAVDRYRRPYVEHMLESARRYDDVSRKVLGRSVPHTLLIHYNLLNTLFLGDLLDAFRKRGWALLDADEAFNDPVFLKEPEVVPAGESLLFMLAKESGYRGPLENPGDWERIEKPKLDRLRL